MQAQKRALGAEHWYAFAIGDVLRHFDLHVVPRFADTPAEVAGPRRVREPARGSAARAVLEEAVEGVRARRLGLAGGSAP